MIFVTFKIVAVLNVVIMSGPLVQDAYPTVTFVTLFKGRFTLWQLGEQWSLWYWKLP